MKFFIPYMYGMVTVEPKYHWYCTTSTPRWEHLWILAPKIDFELNQSDYKDHNKFEGRFLKLCGDSFTRSIDNFFFLRDNLYIERFRLSNRWYDIKIGHLRLNSWLCGVLACNVRELDIALLESSEFGRLPQLLFTCKTLVVLKISGEFDVDVPFYVCLPNLKTLVLEYVINLGDVSITKLLSGCPVLEDLQIQIVAGDYPNLSMYDVSHPTLKRLTLNLDDECHNNDMVEGKIKADAPNLEFIELCGRWWGDFMVNYFPSIVKAVIRISHILGFREEDIEYEKKVIVFLKSIANVESLFLAHDFPMNFGRDIGHDLPIFRNLVELELHSGVNVPKLLISFLESSPKLEVLSLPWGVDTYPFEAEYYAHDVINIVLENGWREPQHVPECLLQSLKSIQVCRFCAEDEELKIVKYLLENSLVLENMTISCSSLIRRYFTFVELKKELENHPRGSTNCQLDILERQMLNDAPGALVKSNKYDFISMCFFKVSDIYGNHFEI